MIFTYNKEHVGDVLMVIVAEDKGQPVQFERKGQVARVFLEETGKTVAWNIFEASSLVELAGNGQVFLTDEQVATLNAALSKEGFAESLVNDNSPKFVVVRLWNWFRIQTATTSISVRSMSVTKQCKS